MGEGGVEDTLAVGTEDAGLDEDLGDMFSKMSNSFNEAVKGSLMRIESKSCYEAVRIGCCY